MKKKLQMGISLAGFIRNNGEDCGDEDLTPLWRQMRDASRDAALERKLKVIRDDEGLLVVETKSYDDVRAICVAHEGPFCLGSCTTIEEPEDDQIEEMLEATEMYSIHEDAHSPGGAAGKMAIYLVY